MGHFSAHKQHGITLIELMVAMVLGLLVAAGIVTVFASTSNSNKAQTQLALLQEEGRFAITRLSNDLRMANGQYCSNTGGVASNTGSNNLYMDGLRSPKVYAKDLLGALSDVTTNWNVAPYPATPVAPYYLPAFLSMRGYDCSKTSPCTPDVPATFLKTMGTSVGARVVGASVLTLRYMSPSRGWTLDGINSTVSADSNGKLKSVTLKPATGEPALSEFQAGHLAMLADCSNAQIFAVDAPSSGVLNVRAADNFSESSPINQQLQSAPRLFDLNTDLLTVTYFLQVIDDGNGRKVGALMRRVNGTSEEVVRGVERLDFLYGVEDSNGSTRYLSASGVDTRVNGAINCPASVPSVDSSAPASNPAGCLWRAVKSIEVHILMDGQVPLYTLTPNELSYTYVADKITEPKAPDDAGRVVKPVEQGFANPVLRREFSAMVSLRNYNP
ncbi:PilW family protein [Rhodanobacter sp. A1T4]|uniref:PilW family protein n=1 Tax=Rhodanobacter sp. A1T4 TaxID=2723087 RepID=UPI00161113D4|nr:PilW family protein [Rhodanobacter sp. A1T4]MBB6245800.1 type IV pilus assembly protein PilW [Rhodanobacter sp. A1T4]